MSDNKSNKIIDYAILAGGIAYFVCPADLIPDVLPVVGFTDDAAAITMTFKSAFNIFSQSSKDSAVSKAAEIFGKNFDAELAANVVAGKVGKKKKRK
ncbi:MAG: DUF1232 domain-containing protein [Muribaculaceae bacterium]|nr:DUF1232 domain-containing protein [Muribaculaceae bacterium]